MSRPTIAVRALARQDVRTRYRWLAHEAGIETAESFLVGVDDTFARLAAQPRLGSRIGSAHPRLADVRKWPVRGFDNVLIFYQPRRSGISVIRILHAASNWWALFDVPD